MLGISRRSDRTRNGIEESHKHFGPTDDFPDRLPAQFEPVSEARCGRFCRGRRRPSNSLPVHNRPQSPGLNLENRDRNTRVTNADSS